tara:strand:- start:615 stop:884 length:270 start_codon:yes stop_codon:yes gene_type:complete
MSNFINKNGTFNHGKWLRDQTLNQIDEINVIAELSGYDDPKFPKALHYKADKAMVDFAKALAKADIDQKTMESVFTNMAVRMAKKYGKK